MSDGITDFIEDNRSTILTINTTIVSVGLKTGGKIVQPAVWVLDYAANENKPDGVDFTLYGLGLFGGPLGIASIATGVIKSLVDDETNRKLEIARASEPAHVRKYILPTSEYSGWAGSYINAGSIASDGGTAWYHPTAKLYVYVTDAKGRLVCDYAPQSANQIFQPVLPLRPNGKGKFKWHSIRGGVGAR